MDVYGRPSQGKKAFLKFGEYERPGDISTTRDPDLHAVQKRALSKGFSTAAMRDQEKVLHEYLRLLVEQLVALGKGGQVAVNIGEALNWFTLDIIGTITLMSLLGSIMLSLDVHVPPGDLAFGESFESISEASNEAYSLITDALRYSNVEYLKRQRPYIGPIVARLLFPRSLKEKHLKYQRMTAAKAAKRIERTDLDRQDFFSHLIRDGRISEKELMATAWTLIMAGSETTATALTATIFYLLRNPQALDNLTNEILASFQSAHQITGSYNPLQCIMA